MVYQVNTNVTALNVYNNLGVHQSKASSALAKISSGLKASGGVDIASMGVANTLLIKSQATQTAITSVQNALNILRSADSIYAEAIALGQVGLEVANRALDANADTTATSAQLAKITLGVTALITKATYNGTVVLGNGGSALTVKINDKGTPDTLTVTPNATTPPAADNSEDTVGGYTTFVNAAIDDRAKNAANIAVLENTLQVLNSIATNELAGVAQAQDADISKEMMNLTSANIMTEAATAMLAQAMQLPNSVLKLLQ